MFFLDFTGRRATFTIKKAEKIKKNHKKNKKNPVFLLARIRNALTTGFSGNKKMSGEVKKNTKKVGETLYKVQRACYYIIRARAKQKDKQDRTLKTE